MNIQSMSGAVTEHTKRDDVLAATLRTIARQGFAAPMSAIAREAGVGSGTIYNYFDGKEALIEALFRDVFQELCVALFDGADPTGEPRACFRQIWHNLAAWGREHHEKIAVLEQCNNAPSLQATLKEAYLANFGPLFAFLQDGIDRGLLRELPVDALIAVGIEPAISLVKRERLGFDYDGAVYEQACEACWAAIRRP